MRLQRFGWGAIRLEDVTAEAVPMGVPSDAAKDLRGGDSDFATHTFPETVRNSGRIDAGNNAVAGPRIQDTRSFIEVPVVAPTESESAGGSEASRMYTGPASNPINAFYGKITGQ